jgi:hypothetical protein
MKPATLFDLIVKSFGVYLLVQAISVLSGYSTAVAVDFEGRHISHIGLLRVIILAAAAVWFLYGAHPIQDWAYPKLAPDENGQSTTAKSQGSFCVSCGKPISTDAKSCSSCGWAQPK